jgi:hypothetical protein
VRRKAHGVTLTPSGVQVLHQARQLLRQAEDLHNTAAGDGQLTGVLPVGTPRSPSTSPRTPRTCWSTACSVAWPRTMRLNRRADEFVSALRARTALSTERGQRATGDPAVQ